MGTNSSLTAGRPLLKKILFAGFCGGLAEIAWVGLYCALKPQSGAGVARQVTASLLPGLADMASAPGLGIAIHLALSLIVGLIYAGLVWLPFARHSRQAVSMTLGVTALASIWVVNFLVVLSVVNPVFVSLLPYPVTLASKVLFGIVMSWVLWEVRESRTQVFEGLGSPTRVRV